MIYMHVTVRKLISQVLRDELEYYILFFVVGSGSLALPYRVTNHRLASECRTKCIVKLRCGLRSF